MNFPEKELIEAIVQREVERGSSNLAILEKLDEQLGDYDQILATEVINERREFYQKTKGAKKDE